MTAPSKSRPPLADKNEAADRARKEREELAKQVALECSCWDEDIDSYCPHHGWKD